MPNFAIDPADQDPVRSKIESANLQMWMSCSRIRLQQRNNTFRGGTWSKVKNTYSKFTKKHSSLRWKHIKKYQNMSKFSQKVKIVTFLKTGFFEKVDFFEKLIFFDTFNIFCFFLILTFLSFDFVDNFKFFLKISTFLSFDIFYEIKLTPKRQCI